MKAVVLCPYFYLSESSLSLCLTDWLVEFDQTGLQRLTWICSLLLLSVTMIEYITELWESHIGIYSPQPLSPPLARSLPPSLALSLSLFLSWETELKATKSLLLDSVAVQMIKIMPKNSFVLKLSFCHLLIIYKILS